MVDTNSVSARAGRSICIVGAAGGIGSATARYFQTEPDAALICMDRAEASPETFAATVGGSGIAIDVADEASVEAAFARARASASRLDVLVVASGIVDDAKTATLTHARWKHIVDTNLTGCFLVAKAALPWLADGGRIVFLASLAGRTGGVLTGAAYAASKGGLESYAKSLATELAPRAITVNCVAPGAVDTAMIRTHSAERQASMVAGTPLRRMALPEEIAATIGFLASKDAGFITGAVVPVNGGTRMD